MTLSEKAAFNEGLCHAATMAEITALTLEVRLDAKELRQRAVIEALRALAAGLKDQASEEAKGANA